VARIFCLFHFVIAPTRFFMLSHTAFSDENVQHKIRVDAPSMEKCVLDNWYRAESRLSIVVQVRGDVDLRA